MAPARAFAGAHDTAMVLASALQLPSPTSMWCPVMGWIGGQGGLAGGGESGGSGGIGGIGGGEMQAVPDHTSIPL